MRILFDYQAFSMQTHGGVSRSFAELYRHMPEDIEVSIGMRESNNAYSDILGENIKPIGFDYQHFICETPFRGKIRLYKWAERLRRIKRYPDYNRNYSIYKLKKARFDVFHPTFFDDYFLPYLNGRPFVLTIHDMIPELYPQYFKRDDFQICMKQKLAPLANAIIAVSETTKRDVINILKVPEEKVHVIYHGCSFPEASNVKQPYTEPYLLYVGDRYGYKDFDLFVRNIASFLKSHPDIKVVCTGKSFNQNEQQMLDTYGCKDSFINHWVETDEEFFSLYHNALCFIYTSEYEGFGIPILEAYKADCPVLLNKASCFPEIAGDAAIYFELSSEGSDIATRIEQLLQMDCNHRERLLTKQRERLRKYSWIESAKRLCDVYKSIV